MAKKTVARRSFDKDFKIKAVKMMTEDGLTGAAVSKKLKISATQLYQWKSKFASPQKATASKPTTSKGNFGLRAELAAVTEERDILRKAIAIIYAKSGV